jgi:hypothetical protein
MLKKLFILGLLLLTFSSVGLVPGRVSAQAATAPPTPTAAPAVAPAAAATSATPAPAVSAKPDPAPADTGCKPDLLYLGCVFTDGIVTIIAWLLYWVMVMMGYLLGLVGVIFNWIVVITVFQYATFFGNSSGMLAAWGVLRDIGNIGLIFGFISMGILMILDLHSFDARKALPRLLVFAVLMNFSLFASEAIVDVANTLAAGIFQQAGKATFASAAACATANANDTTVQPCTGSTDVRGTQIGIADVIINDSYAGSALSISKPSGNSGKQVFAYLGITIFILIVMALLIAASIMFFTRAVVLTVLLVVSPLGFAGMAIPMFQKQAEQWLQNLIKNAFFAPTFLLLVLVGLKVMEGARSALGGNNTLGNALQSPGTSVGGVLIVFGLTIGFMIAALKYAEGSGAAGASFATGFAKKTAMKVGMAPVRLAGLGARETVGRGVAKLPDKYESVMAKARKSNNVAIRGFAKGARFLHIDESVKGGLDAAAGIKYGTGKSFGDRKKEIDTRTAHLEHVYEVDHLKDDFKAGLNLAARNDIDQAEKDRLTDKASRAANRLSATDIAKMIKGMKSEVEIEDASTLLTAEKVKEVLKDDTLNEAQKDTMSQLRYKKYADVINNAALSFADKKAALNKFNIEKADLDIMKDRVQETLTAALNSINDPRAVGGTGESLLSRKNIEYIEESTNYTPGTRALAKKSKIEEQMKQVLKEREAQPTIENQRVIVVLKKRIGKNVGKLSKKELVQLAQNVQLKKSDMAHIMAANEISADDDKVAVREAIRANQPDEIARGEIDRYLQTNKAQEWW